MEATTDSTPTPAEVAAKTTAPAPADTQEGKPQMTVEDYQRELENVRREAAKYRTERNQLRQVAEQAKTVAKEKLTAEERLAALEQELAEARLAKDRADIAAKAGVPEELVTGGSREQMEQQAGALAALIEQRVEAALEAQRKNTPHAPHVPGENAGTVKAGEQDWLRSQLLKKN